MAFTRSNHFTSKRDGMDRAKQSHFCTACMHSQKTTFDVCPACQARGMRVFFRSQVEMKRGAELIQMQRHGLISQLKFLPKFDLVVDGTKVTTYEADSSYVENGKQVVEDVKPPDFMDKGAVLKIALFNALHKKHGISVRIAKRK